MDLTKYIIPTVIDNTDENQKNGNKSFQTEDLIFLESVYEEWEHCPGDKKFYYPTDYAILNNLLMHDHHLLCQSHPNTRTCNVRLRSPWDKTKTHIVASDGGVNYYRNYEKIWWTGNIKESYFGLCPALHLDIEAVISARKTSPDLFKIAKETQEFTYTDDYLPGADDEDPPGEWSYHVMKFGEFPQDCLWSVTYDKLIWKELDELYSSGKLKKTGKSYTGRIDENGNIISFPEFEYKGDKYVRVTNKINEKFLPSEFHRFTTKTYNWAKVSPIWWRIKNWCDLPKEINPHGSGKAKYIDLRADEVIISGIPFYPNIKDENGSMWQNSTIRGYLNGINVNNIKTNGNTKFTAPNGGDFTGKNNFLTEAFNIIEPTKIKDLSELESELKIADNQLNKEFDTLFIIAGLLHVSENKVAACREFISKNFGSEYLSMFDIKWAGNDEKRKMIIAELKENSKSNNKKDYELQ